MIVQDPVWEQSFPTIGGTMLPVTDPATGRTTAIRVRGRDARRLRDEHAARLRSLVDLFHALDSDPIVLGTSDEHQIDLSFQGWANRRRFQRRPA